MTHSADNYPLNRPDQNSDAAVDAAITPPTSADLPEPILESDRKTGLDHPVATGIGAAGGGIAGAALGKAIGGQTGAAIGAIGGVVAGAVLGDQLGEYANPSPVHVVPLRDEEAAFVWKFQQTDQSQWSWQLCPKAHG